MGRKRKAAEPSSWCYYCERQFEDDKVLVLHQKAKVRTSGSIHARGPSLGRLRSLLLTPPCSTSSATAAASSSAT